MPTTSSAALLAALKKHGVSADALKTTAAMPIEQRCYAVSLAMFQCVKEHREKLSTERVLPRLQAIKAPVEDRAAFDAEIDAITAIEVEIDKECRYHAINSLYLQSCDLMVDWAAARMKRQFGAEAYATVEITFKKYLAGELFGDLRERFLKICFSCPA